MVVNPIFHRNKYWISSTELFDLLGRDKKRYYVWTVRHITNNYSLEKGRDYYVYQQARPGWRNPQRTEIHLSVALALAICIHEGTILSRNIRYIIEESIAGLIQKNRSSVVKD